jgi:hypothetical protein
MLGHPIELNLVQPGAAIPDQPDWVNQMLPGFETFEAVLDMSEFSKVFGVPPTSLEAFIKRFLAASRA